MTRWLPAMAAIGIMILAGLWEGSLTGRWGQSEALAQAVVRIDQVPMNIGAWHGEDEEGLEPREVAIAKITGYLSRSYVHAQTQQRVRVLLACGRPGPISVHTPDICLAGAGYAAVGAPRIYANQSAASGSPQLWTARFVKEGLPDSPYLRVYWAWSMKGQWEAPTNPRWRFGSAPALYKLYLMEEVSGSENPEDDACRQFMPEFLSALDKSLFADA